MTNLPELYEKHIKKVNDKYFEEYKRDYVSPQKERKQNICVRKRKRLLRQLQKTYHNFDIKFLWLNMLDVVENIHQCSFNKKEMLFMTQYFTEYYSFILDDEFTELFTFFFKKLYEYGIDKDARFIMRNIFRFNY
jgi:hypothetical protein|tara:strand:+ start:4415 stop:4819 length:405 start_codon:yes stop_codon:yes gene_type:complete